jgi:hypothetical protein
MSYLIRREIMTDRQAIVFEFDQHSESELLQDFPWLQQIHAFAERPHSSLKYQTPAAYAATFTATDDRLRNPDQLRQSPVAPPAPQGVHSPKTLTAAG